MVKKNQWILFGVVVALLAGAVVLFFQLRPHPFAGTLLQSAQTAPNFKLNGPNGKVYSLEDFRGKAILLFFGFTHCPDVCPTTNGILKLVMEQLGNQAAQVQVIMISVDPERDTPAVMQAFLSKFDTRFLGLSGDLNATSTIATQYGVFFEKQPPDASGDYDVEHTAIVQLIDAKGYLRVVYPYNTMPDGISADVKYILSH